MQSVHDSLAGTWRPRPDEESSSDQVAGGDADEDADGDEGARRAFTRSSSTAPNSRVTSTYRSARTASASRPSDETRAQTRRRGIQNVISSPTTRHTAAIHTSPCPGSRLAIRSVKSWNPAR